MRITSRKLCMVPVPSIAAVRISESGSRPRTVALVMT